MSAYITAKTLELLIRWLQSPGMPTPNELLVDKTFQNSNPSTPLIYMNPVGPHSLQLKGLQVVPRQILIYTMNTSQAKGVIH